MYQYEEDEYLETIPKHEYESVHQAAERLDQLFKRKKALQENLEFTQVNLKDVLREIEEVNLFFKKVMGYGH